MYPCGSLQNVDSSPDRLARFQREVLASLNYPNIAAIHGIEKSDDTQALVMELVEWATLADRIKQGGIPVNKALLTGMPPCLMRSARVAHSTSSITSAWVSSDFSMP